MTRTSSWDDGEWIHWYSYRALCKSTHRWYLSFWHTRANGSRLLDLGKAFLSICLSCTARALALDPTLTPVADSMTRSIYRHAATLYLILVQDQRCGLETSDLTWIWGKDSAYPQPHSDRIKFSFHTMVCRNNPRWSTVHRMPSHAKRFSRTPFFYVQELFHLLFTVPCLYIIDPA